MRLRSRRLGAPLRILDLPEDLLRRIATILGHSAPVVACSSREARIAAACRALRAGVDEAERQRFPGATTVREAEAVLRVQLALTHESRQQATAGAVPGCFRRPGSAEEVLASRIAAGREIQLICSSTNYQEDPDDRPDHYGLILPLLSFGAVPDSDNPTALHFVACSGHPRSPEITTLLVSAGADVDARCYCTEDMSGRAPFAWAASGASDASNHTLSQLVYNYQCAIILLEAGCDVRTANSDYVSNNRNAFGFGPALDLLDVLRAFQQRLLDPESLDNPESVDLDQLRELNSQVLDAVRAKLA